MGNDLRWSARPTIAQRLTARFLRLGSFRFWCTGCARILARRSPAANKPGTQTDFLVTNQRQRSFVCREKIYALEHGLSPGTGPVPNNKDVHESRLAAPARSHDRQNSIRLNFGRVTRAARHTGFAKVEILVTSFGRGMTPTALATASLVSIWWRLHESLT